MSILAKRFRIDYAQACREEVRLLHEMLLARVYSSCNLSLYHGGCRGVSAVWPSALGLIM